MSMGIFDCNKYFNRFQENSRINTEAIQMCRLHTIKFTEKTIQTNIRFFFSFQKLDSTA